MPRAKKSDLPSDEQLTDQAQAAEAAVTGVPIEADLLPIDQPAADYPAGTLLGIWDDRFKKWFTLQTGEIFSTDDARLARAQLKNVEEPGRHSIQPMP